MREQRIERITKEIHASVWCYCLYFVMIAISLFILIWEMSGGGPENSQILFHMEWFINVVLLLEIPFGIFMVGGCRRYWASNWNKFDAVVTACCTILFLLLVIRHQQYLPRHKRATIHDPVKPTLAPHDDVTSLDTMLIIFRYSFQVLRTCFIIRRGHQVAALNVDDVVFSDDSQRNVIRQSSNENTPLLGHEGSRGREAAARYKHQEA